MNALTPNERFLAFAYTRRYPSPLTRRLAVELATSVWQESSDCRSGLVDVAEGELALELGIPSDDLDELMGVLVRMGILTPLGRSAGRSVPARLDLDHLDDVSSAGGGTYPVPGMLREWGPQRESDVYGYGGDAP